MKNLKSVLMLNAITSAITGLLLVLFSGFITELFELNASSAITAVGVFLLVYATYVIYAANWNLGHTSIVIALDVLWVIASAIVVITLGFQISSIGIAMIVGVALWVGLMALLQKKFSQGVN